MPRRQRAGFPTYWTAFGQGPHPALMIHCSLAHSGSWGPMARHLSGRLTMTAFDMPGHGQSADWDGRGEIQGVTAQIAADCLAAPADIIGHSFGATVALRLAVNRPDLVRRLILIEPVFFAVAFQDRADWRARHDHEMRAFAEAMKQRDHLSAARAFTRVWGDGTPWGKVPEDQKHRLADQMPLIEAAAPALNEDVGGLLGEGGISNLRQPVLLVEGGASPRIISAIHDGLASRLPDVTRVLVPGAEHMLPITHARQVSVEILRFLEAET